MVRGWQVEAITEGREGNEGGSEPPGMGGAAEKWLFPTALKRLACRFQSISSKILYVS